MYRSRDYAALLPLTQANNKSTFTRGPSYVHRLLSPCHGHRDIDADFCPSTPGSINNTLALSRKIPRAPGTCADQHTLYASRIVLSARPDPLGPLGLYPWRLDPFHVPTFGRVYAAVPSTEPIKFSAPNILLTLLLSCSAATISSDLGPDPSRLPRFTTCRTASYPSALGD
jgi:hypothetical protein